MRSSVGELWVFIEKAGEREGVQWGGQRPGGVYVSPELFVLVHPVSWLPLFTLFCLCLWCGVHTVSQRKSYSCHCWNTYTQRQTVMALISDWSVSLHKKVLLCNFSELIWSSSATQSFSCRSKRDFNDVTEHWGDYVTLCYKRSLPLSFVLIWEHHTRFSAPLIHICLPEKSSNQRIWLI